MRDEAEAFESEEQEIAQIKALNELVRLGLLQHQEPDQEGGEWKVTPLGARILKALHDAHAPEAPER